MSEKKIIAVVGSTGMQGGGVARAILSDPESEFSVSGITRKPDSEKAKALQELGAEIVKADLNDVESLVSAFKGAYGVFGVTNYWELYSPEKELEQAKNIAKAAKQAGVKHVIWSTLDDTRKFIPLEDSRMPTLMGKYKVPHFDAKGEADNYFREIKVPVTCLLTTFYWDDFLYFGMGPKKGPDGKYAITLPTGNSKIAGIAAEDIGKCAYGIFKEGNKYIGKTVGIAGEHLTGKQMTDILTKVTGKEISFNAITPEAYRGLGFPGSDDLGNMFQFYSEFEKEFCELRDLSVSKKLNPELLNFEMWAKKYKDMIPLE